MRSPVTRKPDRPPGPIRRASFAFGSERAALSPVGSGPLVTAFRDTAGTEPFGTGLGVLIYPTNPLHAGYIHEAAGFA